MNTFLRRNPLLVIVLAQLFGTSLWFSINGVWLSLSHELGLTEVDLGRLTLAVQAGFISGTLTLAVTGLADRFGASRIFAVASLVGALSNGVFVLVANDPASAFLFRFITGLCLAGIYPLGMKMVIAWTPKYAGSALAWLVGMLTLGTALPHLMRGATPGMPWEWPLWGASLLALLGGGLIYLLGDGPHLPTSRGAIPLQQGLAALRVSRFRAVAGGYFGHMWELYAFWTLVPLLVGRELARMEGGETLIPWFSFAIIGIGGIGCFVGGWLSRGRGSEWVAGWALRVSGTMCLVYPLLSGWSPALLVLLLLVWGVAVVTDSPQFSALASAAAPRESVGSSLAVMNAVGFGLTLPAIWLTSGLWGQFGVWVVLLLVPGPVLGLWSLRRAG
ncbi:transport protein [Marinobacter nitratireducens]|uniref:Transport protein n=1 Tax=Marinobacter nitratireducens TaxID=1137280 RepID=A0A072N046_9GAMM|nr:MFS transporter [Marinobacter nitratireducens]KEF30886.1 transport protein [Marinobacter nitratireducens]TNE95590.1 MAG: MFS transporter [Gammaproteobacteria bacterium]